MLWHYFMYAEEMSKREWRVWEIFLFGDTYFLRSFFLHYAVFLFFNNERFLHSKNGGWFVALKASTHLYLARPSSWMLITPMAGHVGQCLDFPVYGDLLLSRYPTWLFIPSTTYLMRIWPSMSHFSFMTFLSTFCIRLCPFLGCLPIRENHR